MMKKLLPLFIILFLYQIGQGQSLAVNTDGSTANASALLDVKSTNKGILVPRMTRTDRNAITAPATGLLIFQSGPDSVGFHYYDGSKWTWLLSNSNSDSLAWKTSGNSGTNAASHFLGTKDNVPLVIKTNNTEKLRITPTGEIGFGTTTPNSTYGFAKMEIASEGFGSPADLLIRNAAPSAGYAPGLVFQHARGTLAAPLAVTNGDYLSAISTMNYDGTNYVISAGLDIYADGAIGTGIVPTRLQFNTMNLAGVNAPRLTIKSDGNVGIGTTTPNSTLYVDGTLGIGTTLNIPGGTSGAPVSLLNQKSYVGVLPANGTNNYYQLPSPVTYPGRTYVIRNNSSVDQAVITTVAGLLFPGNSNTGSASYTLYPTSSPKTIIAISDGSNWTIMKQD